FAQDKTQFSTSRLPWYFLSKYSSQRPHELLGQFVKERLSRCSIKVAYSTSSRRLVNRLIREKLKMNLFESNCHFLIQISHSTAFTHLVNHLLEESI
ncbi:hypothetical protein, partial [Marinobacter sp. 1-3A]|uniref:hypothetical protein n=1 Tax=Marinobacter sp. 1-3A TaxID=2582920 RepID=UPI001D102479